MSLSIIEKIKSQKIIPLFYNQSFEVSKNIIKAFYDAGIRVVEYTNRGHKAFENFKQLKDISESEFPELLLGIGTVKNVDEMDDFHQIAKADFIITPIINEELIKHSVQNNVPLIPGCFTPSDVNIAYQNGLRLVKIFPADALGKNYIKSIQAVFPKMNFMPTGGIDAEINKDVSAEELKTNVKNLLTQLNQ